MNTKTATPKESNAARQKTGGGWMRRLVLRWLAIPTTPELIADIKCKDGDALVFRYCNQTLNAETVDRLHHGLQEMFPSQEILLLPSNVCLEALISQNAYSREFLAPRKYYDGTPISETKPLTENPPWIKPLPPEPEIENWPPADLTEY